MSIERGTFPDLLDLTIKKVFWDPTKKENWPPIHKMLFNIEKSTSQYEKRSQMSGIGVMPIKPEGEAVQYKTPAQGYDRQVTPLTYGVGIRMSEEMQEDIQDGSTNRLKEFANQIISLRQAAWATEETNAANIFNRAFTGGYTYGDGKDLCATDHPIPLTGGTDSNELSTPADLAYSSLRTALQQMEGLVDLAGLPIVKIPAFILVHPDEHTTAIEIINSKLKPDTTNNNTNAIADIWDIKVIVNPFLTDSDAWFLLTKPVQHGLVKVERVPLSFKRDGDFDTGDFKWKARMRQLFDAWDWRGVVGSAGAA